MKFRTEYDVIKSSVSLNPEKPIVLAGSCFSQNMARKMQEHGWAAEEPLGTLYNPLSIAIAIDMMIDAKDGENRFKESLSQFNGIWNSGYFDSSFSASNREDCIIEFKLRSRQFRESMERGCQLIVTFGTSICYFLKQEKIVVGNCHKQPSEIFYTERLSILEIVGIWNDLIIRLQGEYPGIKIIFTVSPVRHLKNGFAGNSRSKAILQLGVEEIVKNNENCLYFPAYEIMIDDLRDYRFYASDLVHPSDEAVEYIWSKFCETYIDEEGMKLLREGNKIWKKSQHRPKTGALGKLLNG